MDTVRFATAIKTPHGRTIYRECIHHYPFVLGAEPVRPVDPAAFFATIANEGKRPAPHVIDSVERDGTVIYRYDPASATRISSVDQAAFYQLKTMGVLARGTAHSIADLALTSGEVGGDSSATPRAARYLGLHSSRPREGLRNRDRLRLAFTRPRSLPVRRGSRRRWLRTRPSGLRASPNWSDRKDVMLVSAEHSWTPIHSLWAALD